MTISAALQNLFAIDPSEWASFSHEVTETGGGYRIFVSDKRGGCEDIVKVHEALDRAGLIVNSKKPVADHGMATTEGHTPLGYGDGKGGFHDRVKLSDNAAAIAEPGKGFSFEVNFGKKPESEILAALTKAAAIIAADRDNAILKEAARTRELASLARRDSEYEVIAARLQTNAGRNDTVDEAAVVQYIHTQLQGLVPDSKIEVSAPADSWVVKRVYGLTTQERRIRLTLAGSDLAAFRRGSIDDDKKFLGKLSTALSEKLPLTRRDFVKISGVEAGTVLTGFIVGSSAKLAAEISGALDAALSSGLTPPTGGHSATEKPTNRPA